MPKKFLLIDDDPEMLGLETAILTEDGFEVDTASDGPEGIGKLEANNYDGIVLDVMMPGMDGYETAKRIQELAFHKSTPIVMVTGVTERGALAQGFAAGVVVFMHKPFNPAMFRSAIQSAVGGPAE